MRGARVIGIASKEQMAMAIGYHFRPPHPAYDMFKDRSGIIKSQEVSSHARESVSTAQSEAIRNLIL